MEHETLALVDIPWLRPSDAKRYSGHLEEWPLWDVLMLLHLSHRTARLDVAGDEGKATIEVRDGQILRCECAGMDGVAALDSLIHWERGRFDVHEGDTLAGDKNIAVRTEQLLFGVLLAGSDKVPTR